MWLKAFILTQVLEMPIYIIALKERPIWQRPLIAFGASALTHPLVWKLTGVLVFEYGLDFWLVTSAVELLAVLVEGVYLRAFGLPRAFLWSLGANAFSFGMGLAIHSLLEFL